MIWLHILWLSVIGCVGMAVMDTVGTVLVRAINAGRGNLAGFMDAVGDAAKMSVLSVASVRLTSDFGIKGYIGILPILVTGFLVTRHATHLTSNMVDEDEEKADRHQDDRIARLEQQVHLLHNLARKRSR
jgi:hypothetical protein